MKTFTGRVVSPGCVSAEAVVSHGGLNTLASFQKALQFGDKKATCGDQNNTDLYGKEMAGKADYWFYNGRFSAVLCMCYEATACLHVVFGAN